MTDTQTITDRIDKLWNELVHTHQRVKSGPTSDRRTLDAYRNGILTSYAIMTGQSEKVIRERLMETEAPR